MDVYKSLLNACTETVKHYRDDLTKHDKRWIADNPGVPFLHFARECGTHLFPLFPVDGLPNSGERIPWCFGSADRQHILRDIVACVETCTKPDGVAHKTISHFDGYRLRTIDARRAVDIVHDWKRTIERQNGRRSA